MARVAVAAVAAVRTAGAAPADHAHASGLEVAHEHVEHGVVVDRAEVVRARLEGHVAAVGGDVGVERAVVGRTVARQGAAATHQRGRVRLQIAHEDVGLAVVVVRGQVARAGPEGDVAAVRGHGCEARLAVAPVAAVPGALAADQDGRGRGRVPHEDVAVCVVVARAQVVGVGAEGDVAPVGGDPVDLGHVIAARAALRRAPAADQGDRAGLGIPQEHVAERVVVLAAQVGGIRLEGHVAPVRGENGIEGDPVRAETSRVGWLNADELRLVHRCLRGAGHEEGGDEEEEGGWSRSVHTRPTPWAGANYGRPASSPRPPRRRPASPAPRPA